MRYIEANDGYIGLCRDIAIRGAAPRTVACLILLIYCLILAQAGQHRRRLVLMGGVALCRKNT
jgi:hypothetical protein